MDAFAPLLPLIAKLGPELCNQWQEGGKSIHQVPVPAARSRDREPRRSKVISTVLDKPFA